MRAARGLHVFGCKGENLSAAVSRETPRASSTSPSLIVASPDSPSAAAAAAAAVAGISTLPVTVYRARRRQRVVNTPEGQQQTETTRNPAGCSSSSNSKAAAATGVSLMSPRGTCGFNSSAKGGLCGEDKGPRQKDRTGAPWGPPSR